MSPSNNEPITDSAVWLRDGRRLQYTEVGKSDGSPIFHFHGNGSSRFEVLIVAEAAESLGVRLIGLDRPGTGYSDAKIDYQLLDWPDDVAEVADQLGIARFAIEGFSGGGPYALACAYKIPHRLTACGLIAPASGPFLREASPPGLRAGMWMLAQFPWLVQALARLSMGMGGSDEASVENALFRNRLRLGMADHQLLDSPEIRKAFAHASAESFRQGADTSVKDAMIFTGHWGFRVEEITFEKIFLWQGEQDRILPAASARLLSQALPHCTTTFYPDEGHLSIFVHHVRDFWEALCV